MVVTVVPKPPRRAAPVNFSLPTRPLFSSSTCSECASAACIAVNIAAFVYPPPPRLGFDDSFGASRAAGLAVPSLPEPLTELVVLDTAFGDLPPLFGDPLAMGEVLPPPARCLRLLLSPEPPSPNPDSLLTTPGGYPSISSAPPGLMDARRLPPAATEARRPLPLGSDAFGTLGTSPTPDTDVRRRRLVVTEAEARSAAPAFGVASLGIMSLTEPRRLRAPLLAFDARAEEVASSGSISLTEPLRRRPLL